LLFDVPDLATRNLQPSFDAFPGSRTIRRCARGSGGQTGYPIVDAGMRELWHTGVMHNRMRMVVASFLVKHLLVDWREGERWFWDTLVDADAGSNPANWQWCRFPALTPHPTSGCSIDPARRKVRSRRRLCQALDTRIESLPDSLIHQPWTATPIELAGAGVELGKTYPKPIIDHKVGAKRWLAAYAVSATVEPMASAVRRLTKHRSGQAVMPTIAIASSRR